MNITFFRCCMWYIGGTFKKEIVTCPVIILFSRKKNEIHTPNTSDACLITIMMTFCFVALYKSIFLQTFRTLTFFFFWSLFSIHQWKWLTYHKRDPQLCFEKNCNRKKNFHISLWLWWTEPKKIQNERIESISLFFAQFILLLTVEHDVFRIDV